MKGQRPLTNMVQKQMDFSKPMPTNEYAQIVEITRVAIEKGLDHSVIEWREQVFKILMDICFEMEKFTVNDFRERVENLSVTTQDNRAMGGIMATARSLGWIEPTGESIVSKVGHLSRLQIWRSKLFRKK